MKPPQYIRQAQYKKGFIAPLLLAFIALLLIGGGAYVYMQNKQESQFAGITQDTQTTSITENVDSQTKTYSTVVFTDSNYSSRAYLEAPPETVVNSEWKGRLVIPEDIVGKAGNADINWGDGKVDSGGELGQTGTIWDFRDTDRVIISHTYAKPGIYQIQISFWSLTGFKADGGQQQTMLSIKKTVTVTMPPTTQSTSTTTATKSIQATSTRSFSFVASPTSGKAPLIVAFVADVPIGYNNSNDISYSVGFGDGKMNAMKIMGFEQMGLEVVHTYTQPGIYTAWMYKKEPFNCPAGANCNIPPPQPIASTTVTVTSSTN